jgi:hypothetical protein
MQIEFCRPCDQFTGDAIVRQIALVRRPNFPDADGRWRDAVRAGKFSLAKNLSGVSESNNYCQPEQAERRLMDLANQVCEASPELHD